MPYFSSDKLIRHLTLRQLQIFEAVVRLGGYTRAAEALHLTQPTVSMQVKKLCDAFDQPLLERIGRKIHPTAVGRDVYAAAQDILARLTLLADTTTEVDGVLKGELRIAAITTAKYFMPHLLGAFIARHPQVRPRLTVTNRAKMIARLQANEDDLLVMGQVPTELAVKAHPFIDNELLVVARPDHPLAGDGNISLERLSRERCLVREAGSGTRQAVDRVFAGEGITLTPFMELGSTEAIKQGVMADLGWSVLSRYNLRLELAGGHIAILDVQGFPLIRRWYAVHLHNKTLSPTARTFLEFILDESGAILSF